MPSEYPITAYELSSEKAVTSHYQNQDTTTNNQWTHSKLPNPTLCFRHSLALCLLYSCYVRINGTIHWSKAVFVSLKNKMLLCTVEHLSLKSCTHCQHNLTSTTLVIQKSLVFSFVVLFYFSCASNRPAQLLKLLVRALINCVSVSLTWQHAKWKYQCISQSSCNPVTSPSDIEVCCSYSVFPCLNSLNEPPWHSQLPSTERQILKTERSCFKQTKRTQLTSLHTAVFTRLFIHGTLEWCKLSDAGMHLEYKVPL